MDEFDALSEKGINTIVSAFRNIHISRMDEKERIRGQANFLLIYYKGKQYGIELKSYKDQPGFKMALKQAALYGKRLQLNEVFLSVFVPYIDGKSRAKYEVDYLDEEIGVRVKPVFIATGN